MWLENFVEAIFGLGLFINAALFIPQIIKLYRLKNSDEFSLVTFAGFNIIQLFAVWHGYLHNDYVLVLGFALSFITCGCVTALILVYRRKKI